MKLADYQEKELHRSQWERYAKECDLAYRQRDRQLQREFDKAWTEHVEKFRDVVFVNHEGLRVHLVAKGLLKGICPCGQSHWLDRGVEMTLMCAVELGAVRLDGQVTV